MECLGEEWLDLKGSTGVSFSSLEAHKATLRGIMEVKCTIAMGVVSVLLSICKSNVS